MKKTNKQNIYNQLNAKQAMITVTLSDGLSARIPFRKWRETVAKMEMCLKNKKEKIL